MIYGGLDCIGTKVELTRVCREELSGLTLAGPVVGGPYGPYRQVRCDIPGSTEQLHTNCRFS